MIFEQLNHQLQALSTLLAALKDEQYSKKIAHLGNASIGGHTRHIIELLQCVIKGYNNNEVDYVNRYRDFNLENNRCIALSAIGDLEQQFQLPDKKMFLKTELTDAESTLPVGTTYYREIVYNTEHTIHHLALIKVALLEMNLQLVDDNFGMAYSTIKFKAQTMQACSA